MTHEGKIAKSKNPPSFFNLTKHFDPNETNGVFVVGDNSIEL